MHNNKILFYYLSTTTKFYFIIYLLFILFRELIGPPTHVQATLGGFKKKKKKAKAKSSLKIWLAVRRSTIMKFYFIIYLPFICLFRELIRPPTHVQATLGGFEK